MLKSYSKELALVVLILIAVGVIWFQQTQKNDALGVQSIASAIIFATGEPHAAAFAPVYLNNATTTAEFNTEGADTLNLELYSAAASSTTDTVGILIDFSDNGTNWFSEEISSDSGQTTTHQALTRKWVPGKTASTTISFQLAGINSKYVRISAASWGQNHTSTSSQISFWARYILNKPF